MQGDALYICCPTECRGLTGCTADRVKYRGVVSCLLDPTPLLCANRHQDVEQHAPYRVVVGVLLPQRHVVVCVRGAALHTTCGVWRSGSRRVGAVRVEDLLRLLVWFELVLRGGLGCLVMTRERIAHESCACAEGVSVPRVSLHVCSGNRAACCAQT